MSTFDDLNARYQAGDLFGAWAEFRRLYQQIKPRPATMLLMGASIKLMLGNPLLAIHYAEQAFTALKKSDPPTLKGQIRLIHGAAALDCDPLVAIEHYTAFLNELPDYPELAVAASSAWYGLGDSYRQRRSLQKAIDAYQHCLVALPADATSRCEILQRLALVCCDALDADRAESAVYQIDPTRHEHNVFKAYVALIRKEYQTALDLCLPVVTGWGIGPRLPDARTVGFAAWVIGQCALAWNKVPEAHYFADMAIAQAMLAGSANEMGLMARAANFKSEIRRWTQQ